MKHIEILRFLTLFTFIAVFSAVNVFTQNDLKLSYQDRQPEGVVVVSAPTMTTSPGGTITVSLSTTDTTGLSVTGYEGMLTFDSSVLQFENCTLVGTVFAGSSNSCNDFPTPNNITFFTFRTLPVSGSGSILNLTFTVIGSAGEISPINIDAFFYNEGNPASSTVNGSVEILGPTSAPASVGGRVLTAGGGSVRGATVTVTDSEGNARAAVTNVFGYFNIEGLAAGRNYVVTTRAKGYDFNPVLLELTESVSTFNIFAEN